MSPTTCARVAGSMSTRRSSNITTPRGARFTGQWGIVCFCPLSPTPANHAPRCSRVSQARIVGLSPFDAMTSGSPSAPSTEKFRQLPVRPGTGVARAITHRHGSHTSVAPTTTTFAPSDSMPAQSRTGMPRVARRAHTTQRSSARSPASGKRGAPQVSQSTRDAARRPWIGARSMELTTRCEGAAVTDALGRCRRPRGAARRPWRARGRRGWSGSARRAGRAP